MQSGLRPPERAGPEPPRGGRATGVRRSCPETKVPQTLPGNVYIAVRNLR
ncbi:hypothetical protein HMPREF0043_01776 [Actinobaculum sp. oral taxon 183 str. F0552]|nr:hypothetical protein HMPREF0043_01776 [Actinobaculum sp. oral taxon 183 str. F0552]